MIKCLLVLFSILILRSESDNSKSIDEWFSSLDFSDYDKFENLAGTMPEYLNPKKQNEYVRALDIIKEDIESPVYVNVQRLLEVMISKYYDQDKDCEESKLEDNLMNKKIDIDTLRKIIKNLNIKPGSRVKKLSSKKEIRAWIKSQKVQHIVDYQDLLDNNSDYIFNFRITDDFRYIGFCFNRAENSSDIPNETAFYKAMIKTDPKLIEIISKLLKEEDILKDKDISDEIEDDLVLGIRFEIAALIVK